MAVKRLAKSNSDSRGGFIIYRPECLRLTQGSVTAALLMMRLEYFFSFNPEGFYKFKAPSKTGMATYRTGDSLQEELGMSPVQLTTAFRKIGVAYPSKAAYKEARDNGDIFRGMMYASYYEKPSHLTFYLRDRELADQKFASITTLESADQQEDADVEVEQEQTVNIQKKIKKTKNKTSEKYTLGTARVKPLFLYSLIEEEELTAKWIKIAIEQSYDAKSVKDAGRKIDFDTALEVSMPQSNPLTVAADLLYEYYSKAFKETNLVEPPTSAVMSKVNKRLNSFSLTDIAQAIGAAAGSTHYNGERFMENETEWPGATFEWIVSSNKNIKTLMVLARAEKERRRYE